MVCGTPQAALGLVVSFECDFCDTRLLDRQCKLESVVKQGVCSLRANEVAPAPGDAAGTVPGWQHD